MTPFSTPPVENLSGSPQKLKQGFGCVYAFCAVFAAVGAGMLWFLFIKPVAHVIAARNWVIVPCQIQSSVVTPHTDSDGTSYSADITFAYVYGGQSYVGSRYSFGSKLNGPYNGRASIVANYPVGSAATCYVNPNSPTESVLQRGLTTDVWFGLMALPFLGFGVRIAWFVARGARQIDHPQSDWRPKTLENDSGAIVLRSQSSPLGRFTGFSFFALFWNGIVGFGLFDSLRGGHWFILLFLVPFVLVGIFLMGIAAQSLLSAANARPVLTLSNRVAVGQSAQVEWQLRGGWFKPPTLQITLEGREEATFTRGTDTITDRSTFYLQTLAQESRAQSGNCTLTIPPDTMHSFEALHNKIVWVVRFHGDIERWPDIEEEWKIAVEPTKV